MSQSHFKITVEDGTMLEVKIDKAKKSTIGIVHLFHGMAEHMDRYQELVEALNTQGYDVVRHNHRGHGKEIDENERGHFNSMNQIVDDAYEIIETLYLEELNVPVRMKLINLWKMNFVDSKYLISSFIKL